MNVTVDEDFFHDLIQEAVTRTFAEHRETFVKEAMTALHTPEVLPWDGSMGRTPLSRGIQQAVGLYVTKFVQSELERDEHTRERLQQVARSSFDRFLNKHSEDLAGEVAESFAKTVFPDDPYR